MLSNINEYYFQIQGHRQIPWFFRSLAPFCEVSGAFALTNGQAHPGKEEFANVLKVDNAEGDTTWRGEARDPVCRSTCLIAEEVHIQDVNIFGS